MLIAFSKCKNEIFFSMTDSMNFGPDWIRNLSSEGSTGGGTSGGGGGGTRYQLADYRYGREEMLALFDRNIKPPPCLANFKCLFAETTLPPLALLPTNDEERAGGWQGRPTTLGGPPRGRGGSLERGGRINRGRGGYQTYGRPPNYEGGWGNGEPSDWSPRKEYTSRPSSMDNWRRSRNNEEDDGWRMSTSGRGMHDKWVRSTSWRGEGEGEERSGPPERGGRPSWHDVNRGPPNSRRSWDEDHLPEWATENPLESGGSFDDRGAFHGSDEEQRDERRGPPKRDGLQKSTSQQHISNKHHPPLHSSKSTMSLVKDNENERNEGMDHSYHNSEAAVSREQPAPDKERKTSVPEILDKPVKEAASNKERAKSEGPQKHIGSQESSPKHQRKAEENEFEKLQEDFVLKLVVDEEPPQQNQIQNNFDLSSLPPPPNLAVPGQDKWFYQDPQGQMQGPFTNMEMSEWFKAGYFGHDLKVRRQCDERFFLLGELMAMCGGSNPFQTSIRFPVLKNDISKMPESDLVQFQYLSQLAAYKQAQARIVADPWSALTVQQQELAAQRLIMQQQVMQVQQDLQYMQQPPPTNPLMHMINQMQQANKLPQSGLLDNKPPNMTGGPMDPHLQMHMANLLSLQSRLPGGLPGHMPAGMPGGVTGPLPPDGMGGMSGLPGSGMGPTGMPMPGMPSGLATGLGLNVPRSSTVEHNSGQDINSLLKQFQQKQQQQQQQNQVESLWQQSQFSAPNPAVQQQQWPSQVQPHTQQPQQQEVPLSMWDIQQPSQSPVPMQQQVQNAQQEPSLQTDPSLMEKEKQKNKEKIKEKLQKDEEKELKKRKKAEEEQQKKEADEKRKQEQRKLEADKKAEAERKRKEEERIKKQLERAKKEAEEKRLRELEEKRKLKEQRKLEEEEKKKTDEEKRLEEEDRIQREKEQRDRKERQRAEEKRLEQISMSKVAPWSQANSTIGMSLTEIQKAEKERKAQEAALHAQRVQMERELQLQQQQQQQMEKPGGIQLGWAKKAMEPRKVKSLAEIQAEEQERLAKETAEARLRKEKETKETVQLQAAAGSIWSGQSLSWSQQLPSSATAHSQWSSATNISGFWDEQPTTQKHQQQHHQTTKPSAVSKSSSMSTINSNSSKASQPKQPPKPKPKKDETSSNSKKNHNNNIDDDFTNWCFKQLSNMSTTVDIPTFVTFLRDIESAFEVREYCKDYLGESNQTQQFANNFLEKRRSFKQPRNSHKDDMCSPAPAITPSMQYSTEFQEVKGKKQKNKKSKMLKVDSRILGFNVTSAPDRINVGDRDYGDNS